MNTRPAASCGAKKPQNHREDSALLRSGSRGRSTNAIRFEENGADT